MAPRNKLYSQVSHIESVDTLTGLDDTEKHCGHPVEPDRLIGGESTRQPSKLRRILRACATAILYLLAAYAVLRLAADLQTHLPLHKSPAKHIATDDPRDLCACGGSPHEAIALGCQYDELEAAWLPDKCRDDELTREFSRLGPKPDGSWLYWEDKNHTKELTLEEVSEHAGSPVYITWEWHALHCLYSWRKSYRSRVTGILSDPLHDTEDHSKHCSKILMDRTFAPGALLIS